MQQSGAAVIFRQWYTGYNTRYTNVNRFTSSGIGSGLDECWCFDHLTTPDNGVHLVEAIRNGRARAVSNGSYKESYGSAAWGLEGENEQGRIARCIITLGGADDQSPYHSELARILLIMDLVKKIYTPHNIACEEIKIGCDGLFALNKAYSHVSLLILYGPNYNLFSPHTWKIRHGYIHQDDHVSFEQLNQWGQLNMEMDGLTKQHLALLDSSLGTS